jgi:hypothetical protein
MSTSSLFETVNRFVPYSPTAHYMLLQVPSSRINLEADVAFKGVWILVRDRMIIEVLLFRSFVAAEVAFKSVSSWLFQPAKSMQLQMPVYRMLLVHLETNLALNFSSMRSLVSFLSSWITELLTASLALQRNELESFHANSLRVFRI